MTPTFSTSPLWKNPFTNENSKPALFATWKSFSSNSVRVLPSSDGSIGSMLATKTTTSTSCSTTFVCAFVVIDLKTGAFKPEYAGKLNFYCNVVNDRLRHETDAPTVGLILCQTKDNVLAEYSLSGIDKPIGVSSYQLTRACQRAYNRPCRPWTKSKRSWERNWAAEE